MSGRLNPMHACEQLCRWWASVAQGWSPALTFAEPDAATPANLYAGVLPARAHRRIPACVLAPVGGAGGGTGYERAHALLIRCDARAPSTRVALDLLSDLRAALRKDGGPFVAPNETYGPGVIGPAPLPVGVSRPVWRFLSAEVVSEPQTAPLNADGFGTPEGEHAALMTIGVRCLPITITDDDTGD